MPMLRGLRVVNSVEAGTTTSTQLETLLSGDAGRKAEFNAVLTLKGQAKRVAASSSAMTAIAQSATAIGVVASNPNAQAAVASSASAMTAVFTTSLGRDALFGSKYFVGKALDTVIANDTSVNDGTLSRQMTFANVLNNSVSTITVNATVATAIGGSSVARAAILASETAKQAYADNTVSVAKFIEGELGGNPAETTSFDTVLNASGRLSAILANSNAKAIASAASAPVAKLLAKIVNLDPALFSSFSTFYGDAARWTSVAGNADARSICFTSPYVKANLPFSNLSEMIVAAPQSESKPYWDWKKYRYMSGYTYFSDAYGTVVRNSLAWTNNGIHYIIFNVYNPNGSSYGIFAFYGWSSDKSYSYFSSNYPSSLATYSNTEVYGMRQVGTKIFAAQTASNTFYSLNADLSGMTTIYPNVSGYPSAQFYDFAYNGTYYVAATNYGVVYSTTAQAGTWNMGTYTDTRFVGYALSQFIAIAANGGIWTSSNGYSWSNSGESVSGFSSSNLYYSKIVSNGTKLFLFNRVANKLMTSTNGTTWTNVTLPDSATKVLGIMHDGTTFYLATDKGFYTSAAGSTWTLDATVTNYAYLGCLTGTDKFMGGMLEGVGYNPGYQVRNIGFTE